MEAGRSNDIAHEPEPISRRNLFEKAVRAAVACGALALRGAEAEALYTGTELLDLIATAPLVKADTPPAQLGDVRELVKTYAIRAIVFGDSEEVGWTDNDWTLYPPFGTLTTDINALFTALGVARPTTSDDSTSPFFYTHSYAESGRTIEQIRSQIDTFRKESEMTSISYRPQVIHVSGGGNDALQFLAKHLTPLRITGMVREFRDAFLPELEEAYKRMLWDTVNLLDLPVMHGLRDIFATGLPDLGRSTELGIFRVPGSRQVATAACQHINGAIYRAIQSVRQQSGVPIHYIDTFKDPEGNPITIERIHPTPDGYAGVTRNVEARVVGEFVEGQVSTLLAACLRHGIVTPPHIR